MRIAILLLTGILIGYRLAIPYYFPLTVLPVVLALSLKIRRVRDQLLIAGIVLAGVFLHDVRRTSPPSLVRFLGRWVIAEGTVVRGSRGSGNSSSFEVGLESLWLNGEVHPVSGKILVRSRDVNVKYGHRVNVKGVLLAPREVRNPGEFDYRRYLERRGIYGTVNASPGSVSLLGSSSGNIFIRRIIAPLRQFIRRSYSKTLSGESLAFLEGVTLGLRERLAPHTRNLFARSGVYHILAVSGLHVGILVFLLFTVLGLVRVPRRWIPVAIVGVLFVYAFVTDLKPSVIRASIMASIFLIGFAVERRATPLNLLGIALLVILVADPYSPFDLSFQLSFAATAAILLVLSSYPISSGSTIRRWFWKPLLISISAQAGTAPIVTYHFFRLPLFGALANLYVVPAVTVCTALAFITSVSTSISLSLARALAAANWLAIRSILILVRTLGGLSCAEIVTGRPSPWSLVGYLVLFSLILRLQQRWARKTFLFALLLTANLFVWREAMATPSLRATFLSVNSASSIVQTPSQKVILVDCGSQADFSRVLVPALWESGIRKIDLLLLTRPGDLTGALSLLRRFDVSLVITPICPYGSQEYVDILTSCLQGPPRHLGVKAGDRLILGDVEIEFLFPDDVLTEFASVFQMSYRNVRLLWSSSRSHVLSRLNLDDEYDLISCENPVLPVPTLVSVSRSPVPTLPPAHGQLFTSHGAVFVSTDGTEIAVRQGLHRRGRAIQ